MSSRQKVAVITGASRGIGASLVKGFRAIGYGVVATARSMNKTDVAADPDVLAVDGDIAAPSTAERIVSAAIERFGRIDTLVNNAGVFIPKPFVDYTASSMLRSGTGHIVNITATIAEQPMEALPAALAALTKGGLDAVTRSLAIEYASRGIRVNAVSPGVISTPMHSPETHGFLAGLQPMGRMGDTRDIVDAVLYLERAAFVTGEILHVDGGASAGRW